MTTLSEIDAWLDAHGATLSVRREAGEYVARFSRNGVEMVVRVADTFGGAVARVVGGCERSVAEAMTMRDHLTHEVADRVLKSRFLDPGMDARHLLLRLAADLACATTVQQREVIAEAIGRCLAAVVLAKPGAA